MDHELCLISFIVAKIIIMTVLSSILLYPVQKLQLRFVPWANFLIWQYNLIHSGVTVYDSHLFKTASPGGSGPKYTIIGVHKHVA